MSGLVRERRRVTGGLVVSIAVLASIIGSLSSRRVDMPIAHAAQRGRTLGASAAAPTNQGVPNRHATSASPARASGTNVDQANSARPQQSGTHLVTIDVSTDYTEPADNVDGFGCRGLSFEQPSCSWSATGDATFTGTFFGDSPFDCSSELPSFTADGKLMFTCNDYVSGGVVGCGTGSFVVEDPYAYIDFSKYDPATNTAPGYNTWNIRPRSATGTLADHLVSGAGENHWTFYTKGELGLQHDSGRGHFSGRITCRV